jgi:simple sugar transport system permease protein
MQQSIADNMVAVLDAWRPCGPRFTERRNRLATDWIERLNIKAPKTAAPVDCRAVQRVVLAVARDEPENPDPRRPDRRCRYPQQARHLRGHPRPRSRRHGDPAHLDEIAEVYYSDRVLHMRAGGSSASSFRALRANRRLRKPSMRNLAGSVFERTETALAAFILLAATVFSLASPYFLTMSNAADLVEAYSVTTILRGRLRRAGLWRHRYFIRGDGVGAQYLLPMSRRATAPPPAVDCACLPAQVVLGSVNGLLTHYLRVASIIVTIATSSLYHCSIYFTDGTEIYNLPDWWSDRIVFLRYAPASGEVVRITLPIVIMTAVVLVTWLLMSRTRIGRQIYALGGNPEAASRIGVNILGSSSSSMAISVFWPASPASSRRTGFAAVPTAMVGQELNVLAVAILGGATLAGGVGTMGGVVLGVLLLAMLQNGLNLLGVSSYFFGVVIGLAILVSTSMTGYAEKRMRRRHVVRAN